MNSIINGCKSKKQHIVFRSFLCDDDEDSAPRLLVQEALACHARNRIQTDDNYAAIERSSSSFRLELGIACGGDLSEILPCAVAVARRAFRHAALQLFPNDDNNDDTRRRRDALQSMARGPLSGLSLLYGISASMTPHYDAPTQRGQREEWLVMMTLGNTALFRCNDEIIELHSGDVLVMDSMAVLHGVEGILADDRDPTMSTKLGLPLAQSRLGILFWQGRDPLSNLQAISSSSQEDVVDGISSLFDEDDSDDCSAN